MQLPGTWMRGDFYRHVLAAPVPSRVTIDLNRSCRSFDAVAGLDDFGASYGRVVFTVQGDDGEVLWSSGELAANAEPVPVHAPLAGQKSVRLVVTMARGSASVIDLADWAQARLTC